MARLSTGPEAAPTVWRQQLEQQQHAKDDDEDDDDDSDDDEDDDDEDDDDDDDELDEDEAKAELKAVRAALKAANAQGAKRRTSVKALKTRLAKAERDLAASRTSKPKADDDKGTEVDVEAVKSSAKLEAEQAAEVKVKRAEVRGALRAAGVKADVLDKAARLIDLDDLDVNDDGSVDGIDEAIADARKSVPGLFGGKAPARRRSVAGPSDRDGERGPKPKKLTTSEIQAKQIRGEL